MSFGNKLDGFKQVSPRTVLPTRGMGNNRRRQAFQIVSVVAAVQVIVIIVTSSRRLIEEKEMDARRTLTAQDPFRSSHGDVRLEDGIRGAVASLIVQEQCPDPRLGLTVVTAATSDQFMSLVELMRSLEDSEMALARDCLKLLIYDLGLSGDQRAVLDEGLLPLGSAADIRPVNISSWPPHLAATRARGPNKGWKPILLLEAATAAKGGFVLWLDAGSVVHSRLAEVRRWLRDYGFVATLSPEGNIRRLTHPGMLKYLDFNTENSTIAAITSTNDDTDVSSGDQSTRLIDQPLLGGGLVGFDTASKGSRAADSAKLLTTGYERGGDNGSSTDPISILKAWAQCSLVQACISPDGADAQNHRFERSSLSLTVYRMAPGLPTMPFGEELGVSAAFTAQGEGSGYGLQARCPDGPTLTVALAVAEDHFSDSMRLITALNAYEGPCVRLIVYTMDLPTAQVKLLEQRLSRQHRYLRKLPFNDLPPHMGLATNTNAWRAAVIEPVLREYGGQIVFLDRRLQVEGPLDGVRERLIRDGFVSLPSLGTVEKWTHPATLAALNIKNDVLAKGNLNTALLGFNAANEKVINGIFRPYYECCLDKTCVIPPGATRRNHRFEQAVLSAVAADFGVATMPGPLFLRVSVHEDELDLELDMCMFPHEATVTVVTAVTDEEMDLWGAMDFARYLFASEQNAARLVVVEFGLSTATVKKLAAIFESVRGNALIISAVDNADATISNKVKSLSKQALALTVAAARFPNSPVLYLDIFCRVVKPIRKIRQAFQSVGIVALSSAEERLGELASENIFAQLDPEKQTADHPTFRSDIVGFDLSNATASSVFATWVNCAQNANCANSAVFEQGSAESKGQNPASDEPYRSSLKSTQDIVALSIIAQHAMPSLSPNNMLHEEDLHIQFDQKPPIKGADGRGYAVTSETRLNSTRLLRPLCQLGEEEKSSIY